MKVEGEPGRVIAAGQVVDVTRRLLALLAPARQTSGAFFPHVLLSVEDPGLRIRDPLNIISNRKIRKNKH